MMTDALLAEIRAHAAAEAPKECCGVVIVRQGKARYRPCRNVADEPQRTFVIDPQDWAKAEDEGEIVRVVHSHVFAAPVPSEADRVGCERSGIPWWIVNHPLGHYEEIHPTGWKAPLIGRQFHHGVLDCYALVRDYYAELGIDIPDFARSNQWWHNGQNLYMDNYRRAGFEVVDDLREHDVLLMQIGAPVVNHAAVYIGDGMILQHCMDRLSSRDVYGGAWRRATRFIVRHEKFR
jgi:proteasome lid subunit RPN8/RPN11